MKPESVDSSSSFNKTPIPNRGFTLDSLSFSNLNGRKNLSVNLSSPKTLTEHNSISLQSAQPKPFSKLKQSPNNLFIEQQLYSKTKPSYSALMKQKSKKASSQASNAKTLFNVLDPQKTCALSELKQFQNDSDKKAIEEFNSTFPSHCETIQSNQPYLIEDKQQADWINEYFIESLESLFSLLDPIMNQLPSLEEKVGRCLEMIKDKRKGVRLGAIAAIYLMTKKYEADINDTCHEAICSSLIDVIVNNNSQQEELLIVCCIEVLSLYKLHDVMLEHIPLFTAFIQDVTRPFLQNTAFNFLMKMEYEGIKALVEIASDNKNPLSHYVLDKLLQTPHIQRCVIVPSLIKVLYSKDSQQSKLASLAALNRMHDLVSDKEVIDSLLGFFSDKAIPKESIANILRSSNKAEAESYLINQFETSKDFSIRNAIASVFSMRHKKTPHFLTMKLEKNDSYALSNRLGAFCSYYGDVKPLIEFDYYSIEDLIGRDSGFQCKEGVDDYLKVNPRDFACALNRLLTIEIDHLNPRLSHTANTNLMDYISLNDSGRHILSSYSPFFEIINFDIQEKNNTIEGYDLISPRVIKALCIGLNDFSSVVRDTSATSIGAIGLPEGQKAITALMNAINDDNINVSCKAIWAIGRLAQGVSSEAIPLIIDILKTSTIWKKKKMCLFALEKFGSRCPKNLIPYLVSLFKKDATINKDQISRVLFSIGTEGEKALLQLLSNDLPDKSSVIIIQTLSMISLQSANIDFVIEKIHHQGSHSCHIVRKSALQALHDIHMRSNEDITYMKNSSILPFFYDKLGDEDVSNQRLAINCIESLGPQGELALIDGFTRDSKTQVRINCAIGLSEMGVHNIRTLIYGLCDRDVTLRRRVEQILNSKMHVDEVIQYFTDDNGTSREGQLLSLLASVKTVLENKYTDSLQTINYLTQLQARIEKQPTTLHLPSDYSQGQSSRGFTVDSELK